MAVAQLDLEPHPDAAGSRYVLDLMMRLALNLIGTLGGGASSSPTCRDDLRGHRRMLRQETGAVGQPRGARKGPVWAAWHEYVVG